MTRLRLAIALFLVMAVASCRAPAEKAAVDRLEGQQEKIFLRYQAYVQADASMDKAAKDDELKKIQSIRDITTSLKNAMKE